MVIAVACALIVLAGGDPDSASPTIDRAEPVRSAFGKTKYPWYDPATDSARPLWPPKEWDSSWLERRFRWLDNLKFRGLGSLAIGDLIVIGSVLLALTVLLVVLFEFWRRYRPLAFESESSSTVQVGRGSRIEGLPEGLRPETADPWAEALSRRERGDHAGAIVCLFAHELLTLERLRQLQLIPGRTGRQLVRAIADRQFRECVQPTLKLFEAVYYGHRAPSIEAFEAAWTLAETFQKRVAEGVGA